MLKRTIGVGVLGFLLIAACTVEPGAAPGPTAIPAAELRVDINRASLEGLLKVPGMTPSWAGRILRFRPYRSKQDLLDRGILPDRVYHRIKDYVIAHREKP